MGFLGASLGLSLALDTLGYGEGLAAEGWSVVGVKRAALKVGCWGSGGLEVLKHGLVGSAGSDI